MGYTDSTKTAQEYYNSKDADEFYYSIWGGEDIHVGLYQSPDEPIFEASRRTVDRMIDMLPELTADHMVLDMGAGYGGAARQMVNRCGCYVACLNLSEVQNERNREANRKQGLDNRIEVVDGTFEDVPYPNEHFHVVWSEDSFLHAGDREKVMSEVDRVLKPGGHFIFTDPMQSDDCPPGVLQPVYDRIHLDSLGSFKFYRDVLGKLGFEEVEVVDLSEYLPKHYGRVKKELESRYDEVIKLSSQAYVDRMIQGLQHWVDAGGTGHLAWGILHFKKPA